MRTGTERGVMALGWLLVTSLALSRVSVMVWQGSRGMRQWIRLPTYRQRTLMVRMVENGLVGDGPPELAPDVDFICCWFVCGMHPFPSVSITCYASNVVSVTV